MVHGELDETNFHGEKNAGSSGINSSATSQPTGIQASSGALVALPSSSLATISEHHQVFELEHDRNESGPSGPTRADFETAIELAGYGKFHYILLGICGLVSTSEEMDVISMSFILPSAQCDLNLNTQTKGWLNCIIFVGMMVGAYAWGSLADSLGRKKVLIVISFLNAVCIVVSSFSQNFEFFLFFRFLNGAALGGAGPVIWSYFAEFQPKEKRGSMLSCMAAFWTIGNLLVATMAWLVNVC